MNTDTRTVEVPGRAQHAGYGTVHITLVWKCPTCGGPRGEPYRTTSWDGSRQLACDGWVNPCGHVDFYSAVRAEAAAAAGAQP